jgi:hypothetical protein
MVQTGVLGNLPGDNFTVMLTHHQAVICLGWATFLHIILIKLGVFMKGGAKHDVIFFIHLAFAVMFAFLVMILCYSYTETIAYHSILTILATISYTVVAFIGIPMLFKRF